MTTTRVTAGIDTGSRQDYPTTNLSTRTSFNLRTGPTYGFAYIWLKNPAPRGATILSAVLRVYGYADWGGASVTLTAQKIAANWKASQMLYANRPATTGPAVSVSHVARATGVEWAFDVTAIMQAVTDGGPYYGFRISSDNGAWRLIYALENSDTRYRPTLEVTWSDAPDAPTTLSPSNGNVISLTKPTLRFNYADVSGSVTLAAVQVQIDPAANWAAPAFDSGMVVTGDPQLDLSTTTYAGLAANATTWWRVRVQDGAGLWSAWSVAQSFKRVALGVATITNPAAIPNNFVSEWTPPLAWTFSVTQSAWRLAIALDSNPSVQIYDTGRRTGTDSGLTLPAGVLKNSGAVYRMTLDLYDTQPRESTPGDPNYVRTVLAFTFAESATVAPVLALAATQIGIAPFTTLTWTRSTAPDSFSVTRDGVVVESGMTAASLLVSGTSYKYVDRTAGPNVSHTWRVQAVVNGVGSISASVVATVASPIVWLIDVDESRAVPLVDVTPSSMGMADVAAVYTPIGASSVTRITQAQRGLEGGLSGLVTDFAGMTAKDLVAILLDFKKTPALPLRLAIGNQSIRVIVGNISLVPTPDGAGPDDRLFSFDFWALDGAAQ